MAAVFRDTDRGLKALLARIAGAKKAAITVGVHAAEGGATHLEGTASNTSGQGGALSVAEIATIHEFGTGKIPQRSFIRAWADESKASNAQTLKAVAEGIVQGKFTLAQGLDRMGLRFVGEIQARIAKGIPPELAPETIARKGSSKPLINTGQLRSSIRHKVVSGGDGDSGGAPSEGGGK